MNSSPPKENSLFVAPLVWLTRLCLYCPVQILIFVIALSGVSIYIACHSLHFKTSRLDLINQKSDFNRLWIDYIEDFGDRDDLVVVVEGQSSSQITPVLDELSVEIQKYPNLFDAVLASVDTTPLLRKGLHFVENESDLRDIQKFIAANQGILQGNWNYLVCDQYLEGISRQLAGMSALPEPAQSQYRARLLEQLSPLIACIADAVSPKPTYNVNPLVPVTSPGIVQREYFIADGGRLGVVLLKIKESKEGSFTYGTESIGKLREIIDQSRKRHPQTSIGLTGLTVMENDEMRISQTASTEASILSFLGVAFVFIAALGGVRHPMIAVAALTTGIVWTMGYITLVVGHLNILSMSFGVILIGLGIDFGIHYISRYLEERKGGIPVREAILATVASVGPGIFIGALTTAAAFLAIGLSEFTGIAELGLVSTGGVMLCAASAFIVIPTLLYLTDGRNPSRALPEPVHIHTVVAFIFHFPKTVLFGTIVLLIWLSSGLSNIWYDHNLLHMQPEGLESVDLEMKLLKKWDKGAWFALSIADSREELLKRKQEFEKDPMLKVDEIVSRFPVTSPAKQSIINAIAQQLANLPERPAGMVNPDAQKMGQVLGLLRQTLETMPVPVQAVRPTGPGDDNTTSQRQLLETIRHLDLAREQIRLLSNDEWIHRISTFQQMFAGAILNRLYLIRYTASPTPPDLSDLPESLLSRYIGQKSGRYLMRIYSTTEIWTMDHLKEFIAKVKKVDPNATGNPIQTYEASLQMQRSYRQSAIGAFLAICLLILLDFRSIGYTLLVLIPLAIGSFMALGIMGLLNIPFNPANTIVVPLVLGIGVDDGVHLVHNYRLQRGQYSMPPSLASSIVMTTLTTIIGFGSLMIASHRGLESLGRVLVIGISACTFASLIVMPAVFTLLSTKNSARSDENNT